MRQIARTKCAQAQATTEKDGRCSLQSAMITELKVHEGGEVQEKEKKLKNDNLFCCKCKY